MSTDYRALCAELLSLLDKIAMRDPEMDGGMLRYRARAALAQPEPVAPTDDALDELYFDNDAGRVASWRQFARAVLARWGTPTNTINQGD